MAYVILPRTLDATEKVAQMQRDARFDIGEGDVSAQTAQAIRRDVRSKAPPPHVPKVFLTNDCIFNCAYCGCRQSNEAVCRYAATPRELAELAYRQAQADRHGIFISSAILGTPDYTQELIIRTLQILRQDLRYPGYIHAKVMPGADEGLIQTAGLYANRLSVNIEVARSEGYAQIARNKNKRNILTPMGQISRLIAQAKQERSVHAPRFATTQTTQIMAGSTGEDDYTILRLSGALYRKYNLSRVYYTAYHYEHTAHGYEHLAPTVTPPWRMARLYQADRLMQLFGFSAEELAPDTCRLLPEGLDPKAAWAMRNLHLFPVEVNRADFDMLLRVPGIGHTGAQRILKARAQGIITHDVLRALGISLKRCRHFVLCNGRYRGLTCEDADRLVPLLADPPRQLSLFDSAPPAAQAGCG